MDYRLRLFSKFCSLVKPRINPRVFTSNPFSSYRNQMNVEQDWQQTDRNKFKPPIDGFERKPRLSDQQLYLQENISNQCKSYDNKQWETILSKTLEIPSSHASFSINTVNLTGSIIHFCAEVKNFHLALNFMEYLESKGEEINTGTISSFLKLCTDTWPESTDETILKYCEILKKRSTLMSPHVAENVLLALSLTHKWKEAIPLLDIIKAANGSVRGFIFSELAAAAFKNHEVEMGWSWFEDALANGKSVNIDAYAAWFQYCAKNDPTFANGERMLNYLSEHNVPIGLFTADDIKQYFQSVLKPPWTVTSTMIKHNGTCMNCRKKLPPIFISEDEFQSLRAAFFEKVVLGRDVFTKSTPVEIEKFESFLKKSLPYDIVIDGLNAAYSAGTRGVLPIDLLLDVVDYCLERDMKVVVIGRIHMMKWNRNKMNYLEKNCKLFLAENISQDDPFVLYATMHGGQDTYFASRDLMRGHKHNLGDLKMGRLFKRWQLARQYSLFGSKANGTVKVYPPLKSLPFAQKLDDTWHVPYINQESVDMMSASSLSYNFPKEWLCIRKE